MPKAEDLAKLVTIHDPAAEALAREAQAVAETAVEAPKGLGREALVDVTLTPTQRPVPAPRLTPKSLGGLPIHRMADKRVDFLNGIIYGDPGVGKTTFLATASLIPAMSPMLLLDIEGGDLSLTGFPDLEVIRVTSYKQMAPIYEELHRGKHPYKTIGIDNLTELRYFSMSDIMVDAVAANSNMDPDVPSQREWGKNSNQVRAVVRGFRDLNVHSFFTAHAKEVENRGVMKVKPAIPGQLSDEVSGFVDLLLYYYIKLVTTQGKTQHKRLMLTTKTGTTNAKDRSGKLPEVMEEPTMSDLIKLILPDKLKEENS